MACVKERVRAASIWTLLWICIQRRRRRWRPSHITNESDFCSRFVQQPTKEKQKESSDIIMRARRTALKRSSILVWLWMEFGVRYTCATPSHSHVSAFFGFGFYNRWEIGPTLEINWGQKCVTRTLSLIYTSFDVPWWQPEPSLYYFNKLMCGNVRFSPQI